MIEKLKTLVMWSMKNKDNLKRDVLRVVLGDMQTLESRQGKISTDECVKIIKKLIENLNDSIKLISEDIEKVDKMHKEVDILQGLLPKELSREEIKNALSSEKEKIIVGDNDGKAIGLAMGYFKSKQIVVNGKEVAEVVKEMRNESVAKG